MNIFTLYLKRTLFAFCSLLAFQPVFAQLSGTLTVDANSPATATNFQTLNSLASALTAQGISGNVTINMVANSGPYTEQVVFNTIPGSGPSATVTLNGNNNVVRFTTNTTDRHVIRLSAITYFTINDLQIEALNPTPTLQFYGIHIFNTGSNITINNVSVDMTGITTTLAGGIVASGNATSILSAGIFSNLTYSNNTTTGGGYGLTMYGNSSTGLVMDGNTIYDFSSNGIYTRGTIGLITKNNFINKRTGGAGGNAIQLAQSDNLNASVFNNEIRMEQTTTGTSRGIYVFGGSGHKVYNNLIHDIRAESGTAYIAIAVRGGSPEVYFNTVKLDHSNPAALNISAFSEELSNTGTILKNNIFYITQTSSGNATATAYGTTTNITGTLLSDHNIFWIPNGNIASRGTATYATLAAWQTASAHDDNSLTENPLFAAGSAVPSNSNIDNEGIAISGITTDFTGAIRSTPPDPGAFEFVSSPCTGAVGGTATTSATELCGPASATITVTGYSSGSGSLYQWQTSTDNFVTDIQDVAGQTNPASINTGNITGTHFYRLKVSCTSGTATDYSNVISITVQQPPVITSEPQAQSVCSGANASFSVQASNAASYQWQKDNVDIVGATGATLTINNAGPSDAGVYRVLITGTAPCTSISSNSVSLVFITPAAIGTQLQDQSVCEGGTASFAVTAAGAGISYQWKKNNVDIPGATSSNYTINPVTMADAANYSVVVTGTCNSVTSSANLMVIQGSSWIGVVSNDWHNAQNWCGGIPTSTTTTFVTGTAPFMPVINALAEIGSITIGTGAALNINSAGRLNVYGNLVLNGNIVVSGTIAAMGTTLQNFNGFTAENFFINGAGVNMESDMDIKNLTLTNGNLVINDNHILLHNPVSGSVASHIVTNSNGTVKNKVGTTDFIFPVGPNAASYNPVSIGNGNGQVHYGVRVVEGVNPAIANNARAINRTWHISNIEPTTSNLNIILQYADAQANGSAVPTATMEIGRHTGTQWTIISPTAGTTPSGTADARQVSFQSNVLGPLVIANPGGINYPTAAPVINENILSAALHPNLVNERTVLMLNSNRNMQAMLTITDASGRVVTSMYENLITGMNQVQVLTSHLSSGTYQLSVYAKGKPVVLRFVKK